MLRKILVPVSGGEADGAALAAAFAVASPFRAHVEALFVRLDPRDAVPMVGEGVSGALVDEIMRAAEREAASDARRARASFEAARAAAGAEIAERGPAPDALTSCWREQVGRADQVVAREGRFADLLVFARNGSDSNGSAALVLENALLGSGRPLLLAPPEGCPATVGTSVAIAWNGSAEAARAVAGALPLLARARAVHVLTAQTSATDPAVAGRLADYLAWHGIACQTHPLVPEGGPVGAAVLARAGELGADLLVMGGYGHSRMREMILGGVTRYVITHAGLPVLMAH